MKGVLVVVSGFSGAGKGTVMKRLLEKYNNYGLSISATTRKPREGECDGREYFFKTIEEFESMISNEMLIEYANYVGNYYGTPKDYVEEQLSNGKDVILEIELQGALQVKEKNKDVILIFITPPSAGELENRLTRRGTEDKETINARLKRASEEAEYMSKYDYVLLNDSLEECVDNLHKVIQAEHFNAKRNKEIINNISKELEMFQ